MAVDSGITFLVSRDFEEQRDVLTAIDSKWSTGTGASRARFVYITDALGQRASVKQSGSAFADYYETGTADSGTLQEFLYDARGQLTKAPTYLGVAPTPGQKLPNRQHEFTYDNIGNRASSNSTSDALADTYTTNALNQYTARDNKRVYVSGTADAGAKVVVTQPTTTLTATLEPKNPLGRYWSDRLAVPNSGAPWRGPLSIYTGKTGAGLSGSDLVRLETRMAQIAADPQTMTYDLDGNLTHDGIWSYTWDAENRLVQLTTVAAPSTGYAQITLKFRYDYLGRRVEKLVTDSASNQLLTGRRYLYDGWNLIAEYSLNSSTLALTLLRSYTWGLDIARSLSDAGGVGALLQIADHTSGKTFYPCYDGNGNVVALVNSATGAVGAAFEYSPYGEILRADAPDPAAGDQPFRFSTKFTDIETGLVYYGRRYYSPSQGRFLGRDTIEERGGRNLYAFCFNNSVNLWDYLGMLSFIKPDSMGWGYGRNYWIGGGSLGPVAYNGRSPTNPDGGVGISDGAGLGLTITAARGSSSSLSAYALELLAASQTPKLPLTVVFKMPTAAGEPQDPKPPSPMQVLKSDITDILKTVDEMSGKSHLFSNAAVELLLGTAAHESGGLQWREQLGGGPARGIFQMEKDTYDDIWNRYLERRPEVAGAVKTLFTPAGGELGFDMIRDNDEYAAVMARLRYAMDNDTPLPAAGDLEAQAAYWKRYYNRGDGDVEQYIGNFNRYVEPVLRSGGGG